MFLVDIEMFSRSLSAGMASYDLFCASCASRSHKMCQFFSIKRFLQQLLMDLIIDHRLR